jgi:hypothetical protein
LKSFLPPFQTPAAPVICCRGCRIWQCNRHNCWDMIVIIVRKNAGFGCVSFYRGFQSENSGLSSRFSHGNFSKFKHTTEKSQVTLKR